ncbi:MAG TPA: peptidoglycan-associated lipoprotein Pal [Sphingomonadaceae bacterium]|nr:peptidoglycan-associated lipoprotein Pal [Sphingomonadaceae bacterium]
MRVLTSPILGAAVAAALLASGCAKKKLSDAPPALAATEQGSGSAGSYGEGYSAAGVSAAELEAARADFVARAGSDTIFFNTDSFVVDAAGRATLDAQAAWLLANPRIQVTVEGHADERGTREYNLALGDRRATAARNHLVSRGVPGTRMTVVSWGKERPVAQGSDESSWARNRRAVTVLPR